MPTLRRYACCIGSDGDLICALENLKRNPQLESLNLTFDENYLDHDSFPLLLIDAIRELLHLEALRLDGGFGGHLTIGGLRGIVAISSLKNLQLPMLFNYDEFRECIRTGSMQGLEWLSLEYLSPLNQQPQLGLPAESHVNGVISYSLGTQAELFAAILPSLRGCMLGNMAFKITNGEAGLLLAAPCGPDEYDQLLEHSLCITETHLWHWD